MGINLSLIERYVWRTTLPYFLLSWLLLTVIILLQQSSRYADIFFGATIPTSLAIELLLALLPNILAFTSPMALLTGIMIGYGQLQGDSELIAMRSAGATTARIVKPVLLLALALTIFTFLVNFIGVPRAARAVRQTAIKAALYKLESPLEPGVFSTDIPGYLVYAREGNLEKGVWEKVFIYNQEKNGTVRLITAASGRIDSAFDKSELVLSDANVTTLNSSREVASDRVGFLRIALETGRKQLIQRLESVARTPEEMGLIELAEIARTKIGKEQLDAEILWHRRVSLGVAPLIFALLGSALSLKFARGGRGFHGILALVSIVIYYLASLFAEQTARSGNVSAALGGWLPTVGALILSLWWLREAGRFRFNFFPQIEWGRFFPPPAKSKRSLQRQYFQTGSYLNLIGLLDRDFFREIAKYFFFSIGSLLFLYLIFTTFELWRFVISVRDGYAVLGRYLLFLSPIVIFQVAPSALLLTVLATYAIKSKRSEIIAWGAAGQNDFRLLLPALIVAAALGWASWELQERVLPQSNLRQDALRAQLRGGSVITREGTQWVGAADQIYSLTTQANARSNDQLEVKNIQIYQFAGNGTHLEKLTRAESGWWGNGQIVLDSPQLIDWNNSLVEITREQQSITKPVPDNFNPFVQNRSRFSYFNIEELQERLSATTVASEQRRLRVLLQKHYSVLFTPLVVVLFCVPFAISFGKRGSGRFAALPIVAAFGLWLIFIGATNIFEQFGNLGILPAELAVWSPLAIMGSLGIFLLAKVQS